MGVGEAAWCLGVTTQRLFILRKQPDFPRPIAELNCGPIWRAADIEKYAATRDRRPGRRKKEET
jgi:hypothetical protein